MQDQEYEYNRSARQFVQESFVHTFFMDRTKLERTRSVRNLVLSVRFRRAALRGRYELTSESVCGGRIGTAESDSRAEEYCQRANYVVLRAPPPPPAANGDGPRPGAAWAIASLICGSEE